MIEYFNEDCMTGMARYPDKYFDLAIVDPPYGIGANKMQLGNGKRIVYRGGSDWDAKPPEELYFSELIRVSKNQIIWGANHFTEVFHRNSPCWVFWDKGTGKNSFADGELAYTSFTAPIKKYFRSWVGANAKEPNEKDRIHPTQKPIALYKWLLKNYAKPNDLILDTHVGSASSLIACHDMGFDAVGFELDEDYYKASMERLNRHMAQIQITELIPEPEPAQISIQEGTLE